MPRKPTDRREQIADATLAIVAEEGADAATIRRIAARLGLSTTVVTGHFATARELHVHAYRLMAERFFGRLRETIAAGGGLYAAVTQMTPATAETREAWRIYLAYWDRATRDRALAEAHLNYARRARAAIADLLSTEAGGRPMAAEAGLLMAMVRGLSLDAMVDETGDVEAMAHALQAFVAVLISREPRPSIEDSRKSSSTWLRTKEKQMFYYR